MKPITIAHIYPREMNIYGDNGNVLILCQRLAWRNVPAQVVDVGAGRNLPEDVHLVFGGGGQDAGQSVIADDLQRKAKVLQRLADSGVPMLLICGMYQMLGRYFKTQDGNIIPGIGVLDVETIAGPKRLIGNVVTQTPWGKLIGYENHSGLTYLGRDVEPLGVTKKRRGNNGTDGTEGARYQNVFGTYLHGPVLAKTPTFADHLLRLALHVAGVDAELSPLDDSIERQTAEIAAKLRR